MPTNVEKIPHKQWNKMIDDANTPYVTRAKDLEAKEIYFFLAYAIYK